MKRTKRIAASIASLAMIASMAVAMPLGASAAGSNYTAGLTNKTNSSTSEAVSKNETSFDKFLVMDKNANVPEVTFNFTIAPFWATTGDGATAEGAVKIAASSGKLAVLNGVSGAVFKSNDSSNTGSNTAGAVTYTLTDNSNKVNEDAADVDTRAVFVDGTDKTDEAYVKKTLTLQFGSVQFTEPGVYRYLVTEEENTTAGISNDVGVTGTGKRYRTLDVYVYDYEDFYSGLSTEEKANYTEPSGKELYIKNYILYEGKLADTANPDVEESTGAGTKSSSYTNQYATYDLDFTKTVTGNQGSKDKYFAFKVNVAGTTGSSYKVTLVNADETLGKNSATIADNAEKTNVATLPANTDTTFYLQHGQHIKIENVAANSAYTITENVEDYTATATIKAGGDTTDVTNTGNGVVSDTGLNADTQIDYVNNRQGAIPTGILLSVAAPAGVGIVVIGGIAYLFIKNKRREAEEE